MQSRSADVMIAPTSVGDNRSARNSTGSDEAGSASITRTAESRSAARIDAITARMRLS